MPVARIRLAVARAVALTTEEKSSKRTPASRKPSPKDLFKLKFADKQIGITAELMPVFKRHLSRLLPEGKAFIAAIPDDPNVSIQTVVEYLQFVLTKDQAILGLAPGRTGKQTRQRFGSKLNQSVSTAVSHQKPLTAVTQKDRLMARRRVRDLNLGSPKSKRELIVDSSPDFLKPGSITIGGSKARKGAKKAGTTGRFAGPRRDRKLRKTRGGGGLSSWSRSRARSSKVSRAAPVRSTTVRAAGGVSKDAPKAMPAREAVVSTGFSHLATPSKPIKKTQPLQVDENYYFWLQVGEPVSGAIDTEAESLPVDNLPQLPRLKVALFDFDDGIRVLPGRDVGEIELQSDNTATVVRQPFDNPTLRADEEIYQKRLCFPVRTSDRSSDSLLRCNIYYEQILVQSRLIQVRIRERPRTSKGALSATVDYTLSRKLTPANIALMEPHRLSIMLNDNGNGTHGFRFFGAEEFKNDASFDGQELQDWINQARETMRMAAWGEKTPWQKGRNYLYGGVADLKRLTTDLIRFAKVGYTFYDSIIDRLSGGVDQSDSLAKLMRSPGLIQIALKQSARNVLPAALIYDYPLETNLPTKQYRLCETFLADFASSKTLEAGACFKGDCPTKDSSDVICPSGFWGYRHSLGLPLSVKGDSEVPAALTWKDKPELTVGVSTDQAFVMRAKHEEALKAIRPLTWNYAATRAELLKLLKEKNPQLVYLYCHGGIAGTLPFIQVGPSNEIGITRDNLRRERIRWKSPRPLVFINGCHTAALEPSVAIEFISAFVEVAGACGVIGTEITIFEPLAKAFAEDCLRRFINGDKIGDAVRGARLKLLKDGNPLGLVYIPYVIAGLHMVQQN